MSKKKYRDRITELVRVKASELLDSPANWRVHGDAQKQAMAGILGELGWIDGLIAFRDKRGRLRLINGHMRKDIAGDEVVPVVVVDLTEGEAKKALATFDPIGAMATANAEAVAALLDSFSTKNDSVKQMLENLARDSGALPPNFEAVSIDTQSRLDEKAKHVCPKCGHEF